MNLVEVARLRAQLDIVLIVIEKAMIVEVKLIMSCLQKPKII